MVPLSIDDLRKMAEDFKGAAKAPSPAPPQNSGRGTTKLGALFANNSADFAEVADALRFISSDVERGDGKVFGPQGSVLPNYWLGIIWAICDGLGERGKELARRWSMQSPRYLNGDGFESAWKEFNPNHPNAITVRSLFLLAQINGWRGNSCADIPDPTASPIQSSRFALLDRDSIMSQPQLRWTVKGLLPETGIAAVYGASGSAKSFLVADLGISIAFGNKWFGHRTVARPVTYVMLEGEAGLRNRITAWEKHNSKQIPSDFKAIVQPFNLSDRDQVDELGAVLPHGGVVMIDTLNRAAPGLDENSSQDMGLALAGMKRLQEITGGLVMVVHHTGKDPSKGLRGHSSLFAALDGAIEVERHQKGRVWSAAKVKDGEDGTQIAFKLHVVELGCDVDGDLVTSCVIDREVNDIFSPPAPTGKHQKVALKAIQEALQVSNHLGKAGAPEDCPCLKFEDTVPCVVGAIVGVEKRRRPARAKEVITGLIEANHVSRGIDDEGEEWVWVRT